MSSDDVPPSPQHKPSTSSFADVFKTLATGRPKSQSPVSYGSNSGDALPPEMEGRRGSRVTFGFESLHRASVPNITPDSHSPPSFESLIQGLDSSLASAADTAEIAVRFLHCYDGEQALALWNAGAHLLDQPDSPDFRKAGSKLLEAISSRRDLSLSARRTLFSSISRPPLPDSIQSRANSLISLSDHGRKLDFTDGPVLRIVVSWIVPLYDLISTTRSKSKKGKAPQPNSINLDDSALGNLFQLIVDIITLQRYPPAEEDTQSLLQHIFTVCKRTSVAADIKHSLTVFDAIITTSDVPDASFAGLLEVLCSIHASVKSLAGPTARAVRNLAKSRKKSEMVTTLYDFLMESGDRPDRNLNVIRGAVNVIRDLTAAYGQEGMPDISFDSLIESLQNASQRNDGRVQTDILDVCSNLLQGDYTTVTLQHDWTEFINLILACSSRVLETYTTSSESDSLVPQATTPRPSTIDDIRYNISANIARVVTAIEELWQSLGRNQVLDAFRLLRAVHKHLSPSQSDLLFGVYDLERICHPGQIKWELCCRELVSDFIVARDKSAEIRIRALRTLKDAYKADEAPQLFDDAALLTSLLNELASERSYSFLESLVLFLVDASTRCNDESFNVIVAALSVKMNADRNITDSSSPTTPHPPSPSRFVSHPEYSEPSLSHIMSTGLVRIFLRSLDTYPLRAGIVFERLVDIARSAEFPTDSRLTAIKLLFRLRCDSAGSIYVVSATENYFLLAVLCRTAELTSRSSVSEDSSTERLIKNDEGGASSSIGRLSLKDSTTGALPLSSVRGSTQPRSMRLTPPLWTYAEVKGLPETPPSPLASRTVAYSDVNSAEQEAQGIPIVTLKLNLWLEAVISLFQREKDWDVYSYVLAHLSSQLMNRDLFHGAVPQIKLLRSVLCEQIKNESFHEPLGVTGVKKADVAICILDSLTMLISFHHHFAKSEQDELVRAFMLGIGSWEGTARGCIHALSVCCHEIPLSVTKSLNAILDKMSKIITQSQVAVHILEFLALLARLPDVYVNLRDEEIRTVFGICLRFIQTSREQRYKTSDPSISRSSSIPSRNSGSIRDLASPPFPEPSPPLIADDLSRYVYSLTYHVMIFWFLSLKIQDRINHVSWITKRLIVMGDQGKDSIEEQSQVFIDFMQRVAFSDLGDTIPFDKFPPSDADGPVSKKSWVVGMSIITVETAGESGLSQITKRQASGTTYAIYQQRTAPSHPHQTPPSSGPHSGSDRANTRTAVLPSHVLLQMTTTAFPTLSSMQPYPLPEDDVTRRALSTFDRNDIVDGHKIGVIYVNEGQSEEAQILANTSGSSDYDFFLSGLGTKVSIKDAKFNTQGLHSETDGEFTYAWRDRVTEIVYHVATMMPTNLETDPQCVHKKRHIGNDFVNIIFNNSNTPFDFDTIHSQFNFVNIVISPVSRIAYPQSSSRRPSYDVPDFSQWFYVVKVLSKADFPELSAAAVPKVISGRNLAAFVRLIALNASFYSSVSSRGGGEHVSSWQNRLREIRRLRDRILALNAENSESHAETSHTAYRRGTKPNIQSEEAPSTPALRNHIISTESSPQTENNLFHDLDFSRWVR